MAVCLDARLGFKPQKHSEQNYLQHLLDFVGLPRVGHDFLKILITALFFKIIMPMEIRIQVMCGLVECFLLHRRTIRHG